MASNIKAVTVFCGSSPGDSPAFATAARDLGAFLAGRGIRLVYGGGGIGLMGILARAVADGGGEVEVRGVVEPVVEGVAVFETDQACPGEGALQLDVIILDGKAAIVEVVAGVKQEDFGDGRGPQRGVGVVAPAKAGKAY